MEASKRPWAGEETDNRNAYNSDRNTLTLEWERPLKPDELENTYEMAMEQIYDVKMFYGTFKHDGQEQEDMLQGGKQ